MYEWSRRASGRRHCLKWEVEDEDPVAGGEGGGAWEGAHTGVGAVHLRVPWLDLKGRREAWRQWESTGRASQARRWGLTGRGRLGAGGYRGCSDGSGRTLASDSWVGRGPGAWIQGNGDLYWVSEVRRNKGNSTQDLGCGFWGAGEGGAQVRPWA